MTKHTNKNKNTNRLCVTFEHPEILQQFNQYFYDNYDTVRGYRLQVLEELIDNFNQTQSIQKEKPQYYEENEKLNLKIQTLENEKQKLQQQTQTLTQQLQDYSTQKDEINQLQNTIKQHELTITNINQENQTLKEQLNTTAADLKQTRKEYTQLVETHNNAIQDLTNKHETTLKTISKDHDNIIQDLQQKITSKDNRYQHIEERNQKLQDDYNTLQDTINKYSYAIGSINSMSLLDRILKNYPEEIKELKP